MRLRLAQRLIVGALAIAALAAGGIASAAPGANRTGPPDREPHRPMLALVIDDLGWAAAAGDRVLELPAPITVAVLPGTPSASRLADAAARRGHEIILHQPMEALDARWPGPGALDTRQPPEELRRRLARNLEAIPHLAGVSNHMGSRLTAQARAMEVVLDEIAERDLYFLDSLTTPDSVAFRTARARSIPSTRRDVFLDHVIRPDLIDRALSDALQLAERRGHAVVIGHPHAVTLEILEARMEEIRERVELVPVSRLIGLDPGVEGSPGSAPVTAR
ncbi:MAG: divergent polysaccharide deacetylase family protein [Pseudomonadales bacterium]|jgi:polysaccharide deacetylase 2 family uncharacterized protein YibQ|nr:divergent polysaccharide deacetylase family protein [Pseudomonadales bacterium]